MEPLNGHEAGNGEYSQERPVHHRAAVPDPTGLAKGRSSVTVADSDSDNGKRQKRLIATSRIRLKHPLSLREIAD
jgi:hypothetical protein